MDSYRLQVVTYTVTDEMELELTGTVQVLEGGSWSDVGEVVLSIPATDLRGVLSLQDLAVVVRRHAAQLGLIRKQRYVDALEALVPDLPVNVGLGEL